VWNNNLVKWMFIAKQNYQSVFSGLLFWEIIPLNKTYLFNFSRNIFRVYHLMCSTAVYLL
jgi:hypothetical protein